MELRREMEELSRCSSTKGKPQNTSTVPSETILLTLLATASRQHIPITSSPLNPDLCESNLEFGRHVRRMRKPRPATRKGPEISPGLWLLRRKAALAHQRTKQSPSLPRAGDPVILSDVCDRPTVVEETDITESLSEAMPALIAESGPTPLVHIFQWEYVPDQGTSDLEKQIEGGFPFSRPSQRQWQHLHPRFFLILCLLSACATFFTVLGFNMLTSGHYLAR